MRRAFLIGYLVAVVMTAGVAQAAGAPPVGQRRYVIDSGSPYAPVKIQSKTGPRQGTYLKDPIQPFGPIKTPPPPVAISKPSKPVAMRPGQLRFKKLPVDGATRKPRVEFSQDTLPLVRADEPVSQDFFQKVFEPANDDQF